MQEHLLLWQLRPEGLKPVGHKFQPPLSMRSTKGHKEREQHK